jgi:hypothetical protein
MIVSPHLVKDLRHDNGEVIHGVFEGVEGRGKQSFRYAFETLASRTKFRPAAAIAYHVDGPE